MPIEGAWSNAWVTLGGSDISTYIKSVSLVHEKESVDQAAMGDVTRTYLSGLEAWSAEFELNGCATVDAIIFALVGVTSAVVLWFQQTSGVEATTNPRYIGSGIITSYTPWSGGVGEMRASNFSFTGASDLVRYSSTT